MSGHNSIEQMAQADFKLDDPGASGTIPSPAKWGGICHVVTAAAEARTLAAPERAGLVCTVVLATDGGDLTLTVTNGFNADGDTTITFDDSPDFVTFLALDIGGTLYWRVIAQEGTNAAVEDFSVDQLTAVTATITTLTATAFNYTPVSRTATADGSGTGTIADAGMLQFVSVTSAGANNIIVLPTPTPGTIVILYVGANGYELRSSDPATVAINGGSGAGAESAIAANQMVVAICTSATTWHALEITAATLTAVEAAA